MQCCWPCVSPQAHYRDYEQMKFSRAVFVIHNMAHQGRGPFVETEQLELPDHYRCGGQGSSHQQ
jgi:glycogen synthase